MCTDSPSQSRRERIRGIRPVPEHVVCLSAVQHLPERTRARQMSAEVRLNISGRLTNQDGTCNENERREAGRAAVSAMANEACERGSGRRCIVAGLLIRRGRRGSAVRCGLSARGSRGEDDRWCCLLAQRRIIVGAECCSVSARRREYA